MKAKLTASQQLALTFNPCLNKFPQDQFTYENDDFCIMLEGYVLNHRALLENAPGKTLRDLLWNAFKQGGMEAALGLLRGSFVLSIEDKENQTLYIGNDMLSKKPLYFLMDNGHFMADTSFLSLVEDAKAAGISLTIDPAGVNEMIHRSSFLGGDTYVKEIHFLERFQYIKANADGALVQSYCAPIQPDLPEDENALLDQIDQLFTDACRMAVEKNREGGYRQVFTLSAGMDSRCAYLKSLPFCEGTQDNAPLCLSYGATGCMDMQIASSLAHAKSCDLLLHETNPTGFIRDRQQILDRNEGMMYYAGTTGLTRMLRTLDTAPFGLVITGLGGGEIMGDLGKDGNNVSLYNQLLKEIIPDNKARKAHIAQLGDIPYNEYVCYQDIRTCHNFAYTTSPFFETFSPFLYEELFLLLTKVPQESKCFRRLYAKWYLRSIGDTTPTSCFQGPVAITKRSAPKQLAKGVMRRIRRMLHLQSKWDMNPMDVWMKQHPENLVYMEETLNHDLDAFQQKLPDLAASLKQRYAAADADTKLRILTVSGMVSRIMQ